MFFKVKPGMFLNTDHIHQIRIDNSRDTPTVVIQTGTAFVSIPKTSKWRKEIESDTIKSIVEQLFKEKIRA